MYSINMVLYKSKLNLSIQNSQYTNGIGFANNHFEILSTFLQLNALRINKNVEIGS